MRSVTHFAAAIGLGTPPISLLRVVRMFGVKSLRAAIAAHEERHQAQRVCGVPDTPFTPVQKQTFGEPMSRWERGNLSYQVNPAGCNLNADIVHEVVAGAFSQWQNAAPFFNFTKHPTGVKSDINVSFGRSELEERFGAPGGVDGAARRPPHGDVFFDAAEVWTRPQLQGATLHEVGHALGLRHSTRPTSTMYPTHPNESRLDSESIDAIRALYAWRPQAPLRDRGSSDGPALAVAGTTQGGFGTLHPYMLWKGVDGDSGLHWSRFESGDWTPQKKIPGVGSSHGPGLTTRVTDEGGRRLHELFLVWKGASGDQRVFFSRSRDGNAWTSQDSIPGAGTSSRPSVVQFGGNMWAAWKGVSDDQGIYWSRSADGTTWAERSQVHGVGTSEGPSLGVIGDRLFLVWKGVAGDSHVYYTSILDGPDSIWDAQRMVVFPEAQTSGTASIAIASSHGASIATIRNKLFAVWKGLPDDSGIWFSSLVDGEWQGQAKVEGVGTSARPALTVVDGLLWMAWKGIEGDSNLFFTTFGGS
jgi:hypothetical protein